MNVPSGPPVEFACPSGDRLAIRPDWSGAVMRCPTCGEMILVPVTRAKIRALLTPTAVPDEDVPDEVAWLDRMSAAGLVDPGVSWGDVLDGCSR